MITSTSRSRLYELRRDRVSARRGAELLETKREVLLRETNRRAARAAALRDDLVRRYRDAHELLRVAEVELGSNPLAAAALAQPLSVAVSTRPAAVMGVTIVNVVATAAKFRAFYGPAGTAECVDAAASAFTVLLPALLELAAEETAVARLRVALRKTTKIVNALQKIVLPRLEAQIRLTVDSIDEEERDEAVRRKVRMAASFT
jgi:H(+)-transporting ATP synthase subunit D